MPDSSSERTKKDELKTYRLLNLQKTPSTFKKKRSWEHRGLEKIMGGKDPGRPVLRVPQKVYWELREEVYREFLLKLQENRITGSLEKILDSVQDELENRIYDRWLQKQKTCEGPSTQGSSYQDYRSNVIDGVLQNIKTIQKRNPDRYQKIWRSVVGIPLSQESWLHQIDEKKGIAYIRCFNNALAFQISKKSDVRIRLSEALGVKIQSIRMT